MFVEPSFLTLKTSNQENHQSDPPVENRDVFIHDLKNVMTGALGYLSLARKRAADDPEVSQALTAVESILRGACKMTEYSLSKDGDTTVEDVSALDLISACAGICIPPGSIKLRITFTEDLPLVSGPVYRMKQLFNNLITNSVAALGGEGSLSIHLERELPERRKSDEARLKITISDDGPGVPDEIKDKIFDPGFSTRKHGSGLGLASSRELMDELGGEIFLKDDDSTGATFVLRVPGLDTIDPRSRSRVDLPSGHSGTILVLDDDPMILEIITEMLDHLGWRVVATTNGEQTLARYRDAKEGGEPFESVILDLNIPEGPNGLETGHMILEFDPEARIFLSSGQDTPLVKKPESEGFAGGLQKPYSLEELSEALRQEI